MSYRIALGFRADWCELCVLDDAGIEDAVWVAVVEDAKVIAADESWRAKFLDAAKAADEDVDVYLRDGEQ